MKHFNSRILVEQKNDIDPAYISRAGGTKGTFYTMLFTYKCRTFVWSFPVFGTITNWRSFSSWLFRNRIRFFRLCSMKGKLTIAYVFWISLWRNFEFWERRFWRWNSSIICNSSRNNQRLYFLFSCQDGFFSF